MNEARDLLGRHLERSLPGTAAKVVPTENDEACLAARLRSEYARSPGGEPLLTCPSCGSLEVPSACVAFLACGEVTGSVLVERAAGFEAGELGLVRESVAHAASALANLRSVAAAETRGSTDALTGLPNSTALRDTLKRMVAHAGRTVSPLSLVLFDLDHFKRVNDAWGHDRGDDALAAVGEILTSTVRASDYAGRYGGEEFLVLLPDTDREGAITLAEKLRQAVAETPVLGSDLPLTASFGVASLPADGGDADALVRLADRALHAAKRGGRNRVEAAGLAVAPVPDD